MSVTTIPRAAWPAIDRTINTAHARRNEGVPATHHERVTEFAVVRDRFTRRYVVSAIRFGLSEVRLRKSCGDESWLRFHA